MPRSGDEPTGTGRGGREDFDQRLKAARQEAGLEAAPPKAPPPTALAGYAFRVATELVAGVLVGGFVGYWVDRKFGTSPWGLIGFFLLGTATGIWSAISAVKRVNASLPPPPPNSPPAEDEDEDDQGAKLF